MLATPLLQMPSFTAAPMFFLSGGPPVKSASAGAPSEGQSESTFKEDAEPGESVIVDGLKKQYGENLPTTEAELKEKLGIKDISQFPSKRNHVVLFWASLIHQYRKKKSDPFAFITARRKGQRSAVPNDYKINLDNLNNWNAAFPAGWSNKAAKEWKAKKPAVARYLWTIADGVLQPEYGSRPSYFQLKDSISKLAILASSEKGELAPSIARKVEMAEQRIRVLVNALDEDLRASGIDWEYAKRAAQRHPLLKWGVDQTGRKIAAGKAVEERLEANDGNASRTIYELNMSPGSLLQIMKFLQMATR